MSIDALHSRAISRHEAQLAAQVAVRTFVGLHPGCSHAEAAAATGVDTTKISRLCGPELAQLLRHEDSDWDGVMSDSQMLADVQSVAIRLGTTPSSSSYTRTRRAEEASLSQLTSRFGSWALALQTAGLSPMAASTERPLSELRAIIAAFVASGGRSQTEYASWSAGQSVPSAGWLVVKLGPWRTLIETAGEMR